MVSITYHNKEKGNQQNSRIRGQVLTGPGKEINYFSHTVETAMAGKWLVNVKNKKDFIPIG